ncbi:hypothetical protein PPUJ20028_24610 [Pseudomonas putida]|uniref:Uncharacterized protein n=1 Tax=Pseudomonas putida TaxID=303 RepID=A0AA37R650_PSEPU|nr:hypothetical protein PPUJ20028_24610 [Pseudomonas putida]GLO33657.1 hypothetical protein PPUN14671_04900 [Pseudomonas putida]
MADVLDFLQERITLLLANGFTQQLTQHMDIFTQTHIDIGHWPSLWRGSGALLYTAVPKSAPTLAAMASRDRPKQTKVKA